MDIEFSRSFMPPVGADIEEQARKQALYQALVMSGAAMMQPTRGRNFGEALSRGLMTGMGAYGNTLQDYLRRKEEAENRKYRDLQMQMTQENIRSMIEARTAAAEERKEKTDKLKKQEVAEKNAPYYREAMQRYLQEGNLPEASFYAAGAGGSVQDDIIRKMISPEKKKTFSKILYGPGGQTKVVSIPEGEEYVPEKGWSLVEPDKTGGGSDIGKVGNIAAIKSLVTEKFYPVAIDQYIYKPGITPEEMDKSRQTMHKDLLDPTSGSVNSIKMRSIMTKESQKAYDWVLKRSEELAPKLSPAGAVDQALTEWWQLKQSKQETFKSKSGRTIVKDPNSPTGYSYAD